MIKNYAHGHLEISITYDLDTFQDTLSNSLINIFVLKKRAYHVTFVVFSAFL